MSSPLLVSDVVTPSPLISLDQHASLDDALKCLTAHNITSCPVVNTKEANHIVGWIDWSSIVTFLVDFVWESKASKNIAPRTAALTKADLERVNVIASSNTIQGVLQASKTKKGLKSVRLDTPLYDALVLMSKGHQHQVPIEDDAAKLIGIISQRDVLSYFAKDPARLGIVRANTVKGLNMATGHVTCVRNSDIAIDSLFNVALQGHTGAGIIDANGKLTANLSISDVAHTKGDFTKLQVSVREFVPHRALVFATELDTIEQVIASLAKEQVRRLYLVNSDGCPTGIITLTDVCGAIVRSMEKPKAKAEAEGKPKKGNAFKNHLEHEANKKGAKHGSKTGEKKSKKNKAKEQKKKSKK